MPETALSYSHYKTISNSLCFLLQPSRTAVNTIKKCFLFIMWSTTQNGPIRFRSRLIKNLIYLIYLPLYDCPNKMSMCCTTPPTDESVVLNSSLSFVLLSLCVVKEGKLTQLFHMSAASVMQSFFLLQYWHMPVVLLVLPRCIWLIHRILQSCDMLSVTFVLPLAPVLLRALPPAASPYIWGNVSYNYKWSRSKLVS